MVKLHQFAPLWGLPNPSSFCLKVETYLRMCDIPYEIEIIRDPRKAPKGKVPFLTHNGETIADSTFIIDYLKNKFGDSLDKDLSAEQKAQALALQVLLEEHLYWISLYFRWFYPPAWAVTEKAYFGHLRGIKRRMITREVKKHMQTELYYQGLGRHSEKELTHLGIRDIDAFSALLGDKAFFLGTQPTSVDASLFAGLVEVSEVPVPTPLKDYISGVDNLTAYLKRMWNRYYE